MASKQLDKSKASKPGFEYKMSKKVAELTQVVHLLFVKNHEREVEVTLLRDMYNQEIDNLHSKYQQRIEKLENKLKSLNTKSDQDETILKKAVDQAIEESEMRWSKRYESLENQCIKEKTDRLLAEESLNRLQQELQQAKISTNDLSESLSKQLASRTEEVNRLIKQLTSLEKKTTDEIRNSLQMVEESKEALNDQLENNQRMRIELDESKTNHEILVHRSQKLETELASVKKELAKKSSELANLKRIPLDQSSSQPTTSHPQEIYEELESLRKLVHKYRLELNNREGNFNRMFTEKNPVHVDQKAIKTQNSLVPRPPSKGKLITASYSYAFETADSAEQKTPVRSLSNGSSALSSIPKSSLNRQILAHYSQQRS